jgi:hypothetical protein
MAMNKRKAAALLGSIGGASGSGSKKRRSISHYKRMAALSWKDKRLPLAVRFWKKVVKTKANECWLWTGCKSPFGYGCFNVNNRMRIASRIAWELTHGKIPKGLCVLHHCDVPACCNPKHLFLGTRTDNSNDKIKKGRARGSQGSKHPYAKLNESVVQDLRKSYVSFYGSMKTKSEELRVSESTLRHAISGRTWKHI